MNGFFQLGHDKGVKAADKAIGINPNYAFAHLCKGMNLAHGGRAIANLTLGRHDIALAWAEKAIPGTEG